MSTQRNADAGRSALLGKIRDNDRLLSIVNDLYNENPSLYGDLGATASRLHGRIDRILRGKLEDLAGPGGSDLVAVDRPWRDYPLGTKAFAITGGHWLKTDGGWKWNGLYGSGSTFPTPGGDACGACIKLPDANEIEHQ